MQHAALSTWTYGHVGVDRPFHLPVALYPQTVKYSFIIKIELNIFAIIIFMYGVKLKYVQLLLVC